MKRQDFQRPSWSEPLDTDARRREAPEDRTVRGVVLLALTDLVRRRAGITLPEHAPFNVFKDYPLAALLKLVPEVAAHLYPDETPPLAVRRLGQDTYLTFKQSPPGKLLFGLRGQDFSGALRLVTQAYALLSGGKARVLRSAPGEAVVELAAVWEYPETLHVGLFEALLTEYHPGGEVLVCRRSRCDVDLLLTWQE